MKKNVERKTEESHEIISDEIADTIVNLMFIGPCIIVIVEE